MDKKLKNKNKLIFVISFFVFNILSSFLLTSNIVLDNLNPFPRTFFMYINSLFGDVGFYLLFLGLSIFLFKKDYSRAKFLMWSSVVFGILYFGLSVYFQYYKMFFSFYNLSAFTSDAGGDVFVFIITSLLMLLANSKFVFLVPMIIIVVLFFILFRRNKKNIEYYESSLVIGRNRVIIGLGIFIIGILIMASCLSAYRIEIEDTWYEDNSTPLYGVQTVGFFNYYIYEAYVYVTEKFDGINPNKYETVEKKLENYKKNENISPISGKYFEDSLYQGIFEDKNLLLIQLESFNNFAIGLQIEVDGKYIEITPNLNRIALESLYFDKFYTSVGIGNTSDSEFTVLSGLYPIGNDYIIYDHDDVQYPTLSKTFNAEGYYTFSSHANTGKFYERERVHKTVYGFDEHYGKEKLEVENEKLIHTWLNDYDFLMQNIDIFHNESLDAQVFAHLITITCHVPYSRPSESIGDAWFFDRINLFPDDLILVDNQILNKQIIGYLEHLAFTDYAIGESMDKLKQLGLHEDTIIVIYGDHGSSIDAFELFYENNEILKNDINPDMIALYSQGSNNFMNRLFEANIPLIIYDPSTSPIITPKKFSLVRGANTIARTIGSLFNIHPEYYFGIDALTNINTFAYNPRNLDIYADGIIISGQSKEYYIYDESYKEYYNTEKVNEIIEVFLEYKDFNDKIIKYRVFPLIE